MIWVIFSWLDSYKTFAIPTDPRRVLEPNLANVRDTTVYNLNASLTALHQANTFTLMFCM